jgi:hypothetical protein
MLPGVLEKRPGQEEVLIAAKNNKNFRNFPLEWRQHRTQITVKWETIGK